MASIADTGSTTALSVRRRSRLVVLWRWLRRMRRRQAAMFAMRRELTDLRLLEDVGVQPALKEDFADMFGRELLRSGLRGKE